MSGITSPTFHATRKKRQSVLGRVPRDYPPPLATLLSGHKLPVTASKSSSKKRPLGLRRLDFGGMSREQTKRELNFTATCLATPEPSSSNDLTVTVPKIAINSPGVSVSKLRKNINLKSSALKPPSRIPKPGFSGQKNSAPPSRSKEAERGKCLNPKGKQQENKVKELMKEDPNGSNVSQSFLDKLEKHFEFQTEVLKQLTEYQKQQTEYQNQQTEQHKQQTEHQKQQTEHQKQQTEHQKQQIELQKQLINTLIAIEKALKCGGVCPAWSENSQTVECSSVTETFAVGDLNHVSQVPHYLPEGHLPEDLECVNGSPSTGSSENCNTQTSVSKDPKEDPEVKYKSRKSIAAYESLRSGISFLKTPIKHHTATSVNCLETPTTKLSRIVQHQLEDLFDGDGSK